MRNVVAAPFIGVIAGVLLAATPQLLAVGDDVIAAQFSVGTLDGWQPQGFAASTTYSLVTDADRTVVHAVSNNSASALGRRIRIDLGQTPWVTWQWKIGNRLDALDERSKAGDDYAARIYLVVDGGLLKWRTRTVTYVWSSNNPAGASWRNAHNPRHAAVVAVRGRDDDVAVWQIEKRNAYDDFKTAFGREVRFIDAVVVMTDTDNSAQRAEAWYGDIIFSAH